MYAKKVIGMMAIVIFTTSTVWSLPEDPVIIPDDALRSVIQEALGITDGRDPTEAEMATLIQLWGSDRGIADLTGLEFATNMEMLYLQHNQISDLSSLSGLTNLTFLDLTDNQISYLSPLSGLTNLVGLQLSSNQISDVNPLSGLTNLDSLRLRGNLISDIGPLSGLTNLTDMVLGDNPISDLSPLSGLTSLTGLKLERIQNANIYPLSGLINLEFLTVQGNGIMDISPLMTLTNLESLMLNDNQISNVNPVSGLMNLTDLGLERNQISDISPLSGLTNLTGLSLSQNQISDLSPLSGLTNLTKLKLEKNQFSDIFSLSSLTNLTMLELQKNQISDISSLSGLTNLLSLNLGGPMQISDISPLSGMIDLEYLNLNKNEVSDLSPLSGLTNLITMNLDLNQFSDVSPLAGLTNLAVLNIKRNSLSWDSHFIFIPIIETKNPGIKILYDPWIDTDSDGISAETENGAPNGGDGNNDGTPDGLQNEVASLPNAVDAGYVTLESPPETYLVSVTATANPSQEPLPEGVEFPIGFFEFTVQGITPGSAITVTVFTSAEVETYYKYGPTLGNLTPHWYEFLYDGTTGAEILSDRVILHLVDGLRGDYDLETNGEVIEPGGPAIILNEFPVADAGPDQTVYAWIDGIAEVALDGSGSYDPDDDEHTFQWTWIINGDTHTEEGVSPTIELPIGVQTIELVVNDGIEDSDPDEVVITIIEPMASQLCILPPIMHRHRGFPEITAVIRLPEGITKDQVALDEPLMLYPGGIEATCQTAIQWHRRGILRTSIIAFFNKSELMDAVPDDGSVELFVIGQLNNGQYFYGSDTVRIVSWFW